MKKKIVVIDGQGGRIGSLIIESLKGQKNNVSIVAIGTNSIATANMLKSGADFGATGENPVIVNSEDADFIVGPIGIVIANSLIGEVTPKMAVAVGSSKARKILLPVNKCNNVIIGTKDISIQQFIDFALEEIMENLK